MTTKASKLATIAVVIVSVLALSHTPLQARWRMTAGHGWDIRRVCKDGIRLGMTLTQRTRSLGIVNLTNNTFVLNTVAGPLLHYPDFYSPPLSTFNYFSGYGTFYWISPLSPGTLLQINTESFTFTVEDCSIADFHGSNVRLRVPGFRVAYVHGANATLRNYFQNLLADNAYDTVLVPLAATATFDFSTVQAIIVADDTGDASGWYGTNAALNRIRDAGKPVVGIGLGGSQFFDREGLAIGYSHADASGFDSSVEVVDSNNPIWIWGSSTPTTTEIYASTANTTSLAIRDPITATGVTRIGRRVGSPDRYPLIGQLYNGQCQLLWGWRAGPDMMHYFWGRGIFLRIFSTQACTGGPLPTTGPSTIRSTITISESAIIKDLDVGLYVEHPNDQDLQVSLTSPAGTTVRLFSGIGGSGDDFGKGCSHWADTLSPNGGYKSLVLDDEATNSIVSATAPFTSALAYRPQGNTRLSDFDRQNAKGTWTLTITDTNPSAFDGILDCWSLQVTASHYFLPVVRRV